MPITAVQVFYVGLAATRRHVVETLSSWVHQRSSVFFANGGALMAALLSFASVALATPRVDDELRSSLQALCRTLVLGAASFPPRTPALNAGPAAKWDGSLGAATLALGSARDYAEELTLLVHEWFRATRTDELLFLGKDPDEDVLARKAPNLLASLRFTEILTQWIMQAVLSEPTRARRASMRDFFLDIARHCAGMANINTCKDVILSLGHTYLTRLEEPWKGLDDEFYEAHRVIFEDARHILSLNLMLAAPRPMCPVIGAFKYWAVQADMKCPLLYPDKPGLFNTEKFRGLGKHVRLFREMQEGEYYWESRPAVRALLLNMEPSLLSFDQLETLSESIKPIDPRLKAALSGAK